MNPLPVVLAADRRFAEQLITTVKSVCRHNRNVCFYLLNRDFPAEWFACLNRFLALTDSRIVDVKIQNDLIRQFSTYPHISDATFFRYFIPELIEEDVLLYLDCDLVVNGSLRGLFDIALNDAFVVATTDHISELCHHRGQDYFNAGVLLINNRMWRQHQICRQALEISAAGITPPEEGDQGVLNYLFHGRYLRTGRFFNYQVGVDYVFAGSPHAPPVDDLQGMLPLIVHYNTQAKPWLDGYRMRFRDLYWHYYGLEWAEIAAAHANE